MSLIEEKTTTSNRATLFGIMNLAWPIAGIIAPSLSGFIAENWGWGLSFYLASGVLIISLLPAFLLQDKPLINTDALTQEKDKEEFYTLTRPSLKEYIPFFVLIFSLHFAMTMGQGTANMVLPLYLKNQILLSPSTIGLFFTASNALTLLTQIPSGWLADRYGRKRLVVISLIPVPILFFSWTITRNWNILLVLYAISFGLWSMTWPATIAVLSDNIPKDLFSTGIGIRMTGARLGFTIGPLIGGYLYSSYSHTSPFIASAICYSVAIVLALFLKEKKN
jgi:MFS family permease